MLAKPNSAIAVESGDDSRLCADVRRAAHDPRESVLIYDHRDQTRRALDPRFRGECGRSGISVTAWLSANQSQFLDEIGCTRQVAKTTNPGRERLTARTHGSIGKHRHHCVTNLDRCRIGRKAAP